VHQLASRQERNLTETLRREQLSKIPAWFDSVGDVVQTNIRQPVSTSITQEPGLGGATILDVMDGDLEEDIPIQVVHLRRTAPGHGSLRPDLARPAVAAEDDTVFPASDASDAAAVTPTTSVASLESVGDTDTLPSLPSSVLGSTSLDGSTAPTATAAPQPSAHDAPPHASPAQQFELDVQSSLASPLGGPDFEASEVGQVTQRAAALEAAVDTLKRRALEQAQAAAAADAALRAKVRAQMLGHGASRRRRRRHGGQDPSAPEPGSISALLAAAHVDEAAEAKKKALATPLSAQMGRTGAGGTSSSLAGGSAAASARLGTAASSERPTTAGTFASACSTSSGMPPSLRQASFASLGPGQMGATAMPMSMPGASSSTTDMGASASASALSAVAPDTGCVWTPSYVLHCVL